MEELIAMDNDRKDISYGEIVWKEMVTWFNHTVEKEASFFIRKHEVENFISFISDLKLKIIKLQEELKNGKTDS